MFLIKLGMGLIPTSLWVKGVNFFSSLKSFSLLNGLCRLRAFVPFISRRGGVLHCCISEQIFSNSVPYSQRNKWLLQSHSKAG